MELRFETQQNPVADEVSAITAVVRPILLGVLYALKKQVVGEVGGYDDVRLFLLPRLYRRGDGDCGICFEYAVHDAVHRGEAAVLDRVDHTLRKICKVPGSEAASILFGAEKTGSQQLIETAQSLLTDESRLLSGYRGHPVKLRRHLSAIAEAFRRKGAGQLLPSSISGLWKADLFLGNVDADRWVGTSVKLNRADLEHARGLRIGIVPTLGGRDDKPVLDDKKNLAVCPLPYDGSFVQIFYQAWSVVQQLINADMNMPKEVALPRAPERQVAQLLVDRREFLVLDVVDALRPLAQPELLVPTARDARLVLTRASDVETAQVIAPIPKLS
jgi:hypothetical protein